MLTQTSVQSSGILGHQRPGTYCCATSSKQLRRDSTFFTSTVKLQSRRIRRKQRFSTTDLSTQTAIGSSYGLYGYSTKSSMRFYLKLPPQTQNRYSTPFPKLLFSCDGRLTSVSLLQSKTELGDINHHVIAVPAFTALTMPMRRRGFPPTLAPATHRCGT